MPTAVLYLGLFAFVGCQADAGDAMSQIEEAPLRFDGIYASKPITSFKEYDFDSVAHKYRQYRYFLRFYPEGFVSALYGSYTPAEAFMTMGPTPDGSLRYTLSGSYLEISSDVVVYRGQVVDSMLDLDYDDNSYMGYSNRPFSFTAVG